MSGAALFDRRCNLLVATAGGSALDLGALHVKFSITKSDVQSPNWADIKVHNLRPEVALQIRKEFTRVVLQAGYAGALGVIFEGTIKQVRIGKENGTDTFISIAAADGDAGYNFATVHRTLDAGATLGDQVKTALAPMSAHGIGEGFLEDLGGPRLPRGKVMFGMSRDYLRTAAKSGSATFSIQDGKVQILRRTSIAPGQAVVLSSSSGLIGTPTQTDRGVEARSLINHLLRVGARVKIDESAILEAQAQAPSSSGAGSSSSGKPSKSGKKTYRDGSAAPAALAADGIYRILSIEYQGDNRGDDWYADIVALATSESATAGQEVPEQ